MSEQNIMYISADKNNGYPCLPNLPEPEKFKFDEPYPKKMMRVSADINDGYPCLPNLPKPEKFKFESPYPKKMMRVSADKNNGYPHLPFLLPKLNLYIQQSKPLIHVYGSRTTDFESNGYAVLEPTSCTVKHELDGRFDVQAVFYKDEKTYYIKKNSLLKIPIKYHGKFKQQIFRVYKISKDMDSEGYQTINVDARALFYDLNAKILEDCRPTSKNCKDAIDHIFNSVKGGISSGVCFAYSSNIADIRTAQYQKKTVTQALIGADNSIVNRWGGHLYRDNNYFSINKDMEDSRTTGVIRYGSNMKEISFTEDVSDCCTWIIAYDNFGNKIENHDPSVPNDNFPFHIYRTVVFNYDAENKEQFNEDAQNYLDDHKQSAVNIKVKLADICGREEYSDFLDLDNFEVGDRVIIYHEDLDICYSNLMIISKDYDAAAHETTGIEIGSLKNAVYRAGYMSETISDSNTAVDKQNAAIQAEIKDNKLKMLSTWRGARAFTWREVSKFTWREVSKNGRENNES